MKQIKVGLIGLGAIVETNHLIHLQEMADVKISAVADVDLERARQMADRYHIPRYFEDVQELVENVSVDAIIICTPNVTHISIARIAAEKGIHVFMEKPIGTDLREVKDYLALARENQVLTMMGMIHRFRSDANILKEYVDRDEFGDVYYAKAKLFRRRGTPRGWFTNKELAGGGAMMDIGVHVLDLAWWIMGSPQVRSITGQTLTGIGQYDTRFSRGWKSTNKNLNADSTFNVEDFGTAWMRFDNGMVLSLEVAWAMNGEQDGNISLELFGDKGGGVLSPLTIFNEENGVIVNKKPYVESSLPFKKELEHFVNCIQENTTPSIDGEQGYEVLKMLNGIYESSEKQKEITY